MEPIEQTKKCDVDGCGDDAVWNYAWDWGQQGVCCAKHLTVLLQKASQLNRTVMYTAVVPATPPPLTRDQRTQLIASKMVLEEELVEARARGLELYRKVGELTQQVQLHVMREREANAQIRDGIHAVTLLEEKLEARDREHADLVQEVERLRTLEAFMQGMTTTPTKPPVLVEGEPV